MSPCFRFSRQSRQDGFTLLEVLVALTVLSLVALLVIRVSGDSLSQLAETGWADQAVCLGRAKLVALLREDRKNLEQRGTLAPEMPEVEWHSKLYSLRGLNGKRLEFTLTEAQGTLKREVVLEYVLPE
ncbi:MAG: prepilin-type N-terminal cleavage/methylation domain-containing protein [Desulfovibrio sp.]|uniref:type IV pilus modification PilV family protein n=1 Tax=Desulfovibrio sp. TaxID=885 RepID=UPI0025B84FA9|nr:prepilin-type N-terminal cleavage/methylation domain-containing protein [Desulfovibrio sp.]MBS6830509.1 prepilin-type N-terminal cleavage/methylation domain-containing protein [Desulfovibrio sp.]